VHEPAEEKRGVDRQEARARVDALAAGNGEGSTRWETGDKFSEARRACGRPARAPTLPYAGGFCYSVVMPRPPTMTTALHYPDVLPLLLAACPSFEPSWQEYISWQEDRELVIVDLGEFARHLGTLTPVGPVDELRRVFEVVERLMVEGDADVQTAVVTGLLESLPFDIEDGYADAGRAFGAYFGLETAAAWRALAEMFE
jgi:hypothetical protein